MKLFDNSNSSIVFTTPKGNPYKGNTPFRTVWRNTLKKANIGYFTLHCFRHTFVSNLIVNHNIDSATVMALSGHKDIKMLKRYSHTREKAKFIAINKLSLKENTNVSGIIFN